MLQFAIFPDDKMGKKKITGLKERSREYLKFILEEGGSGFPGEGPGLLKGATWWGEEG